MTTNAESTKKFDLAATKSAVEKKVILLVNCESDIELMMEALELHTDKKERLNLIRQINQKKYELTKLKSALNAKQKMYVMAIKQQQDKSTR